MIMRISNVRKYFKIFILVNILIITIVIFLCYTTSDVKSTLDVADFAFSENGRLSINAESVVTDYNVWITFTKVDTNAQLQFKFSNLLENLLNVSSIPLHYHVISDASSKEVAETEFSILSAAIQRSINVTFYDIEDVTTRIQDITSVFIWYFSGSPGTYYNDVLFFISLGLDRIAPASQDYAVMLDCDLYFKDDIALVFDEFNRFKSTALFGLAPELSPAYRDVLGEYRKNHNTTFGDYYNFSYWPEFPHPRGFQGYNSGVVLVNLHRIREWSNYSSLLTEEFVKPLVAKYMFINNLGDQDFFSILGYEYPDLIQTLNCGFNRQLCRYWNRNGYKDVFEEYAKCNHKIVVLHGNCNAKLPNE